MTETNRIEYKLALTKDLDLEKEVLACFQSKKQPF
jgi:hypothetical protein